jgi:hypothetical protein
VTPELGATFAASLPIAIFPVRLEARVMSGYHFDWSGFDPDGTCVLIYATEDDITERHIAIDLGRAYFDKVAGNWSPGMPLSPERQRWVSLAQADIWPQAISLSHQRAEVRRAVRGLAYTDPWGELFGAACAAVLVAGSPTPPSGIFRSAAAAEEIRAFILSFRPSAPAPTPTPAPPPVPSPAMDATEVLAISPNRWPGALRDLRYTVIHTTEGTSSLGWLRNPASQVSATLLIPREGPTYWRLGADDDAMWHAGLVADPTTPLYDGTNPNLEARGIELEGFAREPITAWQLNTAAAIIKAWGKPLVGHFELATSGPNFRSDPGAANFAVLKAAVEGVMGAGPFTDEQITWLDDFVKRTFRVMLTSPEGAQLVEYAIRQPGGYASKLQAWLDQNVARRISGRGERRTPVADPFTAPATSPSQKGEWPADRGPEPRAPERGDSP